MAGSKGVSALMDLMAKRGARHGKKDKELVQTAHDSLAMLADCAHCGAGDMQKANARHSKADLDRIKKAHDTVVELGAMCPSDKVQKPNA